LANAPRLAHDLVILCWVPPRLQKDDFTHLLDVESNRARITGQEEDTW
jgi:hypothetical protein